ncbi:HNH endonuclease [Lentibacillus saliphilus]|uniref:HNH endonuclease n=1 Tax=Lentibacillus saliphilus TaxID=2737028 RepID=UPI001C2F13AC|nr:HNH endonuclease [Lentibacillus saliphilus]
MAEYKTEAQKKKFYRSKAWIQLREDALERDNYECQWCKKEGGVTVDSVKQPGKRKEIVLNVDHKYPIENYPRLALVLDNLETLCVYHHNVKEGRIFKRKKPKWDDERW